jgi:Fe2+ or Zn2+ uptake regulation protein
MQEENNQVTTDWMNTIQSDGSRMTLSRKAVIEILAESDRAMDPTKIFDEARQLHPRLGLMTVYRTLEKLEETGLIQRVHQPGGCNMYFAAPVGHQHLLLCKGCGRVELFSGDDIEPLLEQIGSRKHYEIQDHWLQLFGICAKCMKKE